MLLIFDLLILLFFLTLVKLMCAILGSNALYVLRKNGHFQSVPKNRDTYPSYCPFGLATGVRNHFCTNFSHLQIIGQNLMSGGVNQF